MSVKASIDAQQTFIFKSVLVLIVLLCILFTILVTSHLILYIIYHTNLIIFYLFVLFRNLNAFFATQSYLSLASIFHTFAVCSSIVSYFIHPLQLLCIHPSSHIQHCFIVLKCIKPYGLFSSNQSIAHTKQLCNLSSNLTLCLSLSVTAFFLL